MCSLNGFFGIDAVDPETLVRTHRGIATSLRHRGPDRYGEAIRNHGALFTNEFLVTGTGAFNQPASTVGVTTIAAAMNGEIYNYLELNRDLQADGIAVSSDSDVETLLHLYERHELDAFPRLHGMFTVAIVDDNRRRCVLARDRFGEKPLFYVASEGMIHFASESSYLIPLTTRNINVDELTRLLVLGFAENHVVDQIERLPPATVLVADERGVELIRYWRPQFFVNYERNASTAVNESLEVLRRAGRQIRPRTRDFGVYASGGLDSAMIAMLLKECGPVDLFTSGLVGVDTSTDTSHVDADYRGVESSGNELAYADVLAEAVGDSYVRREFTDRELTRHLHDMVAHLPGGPVVSTSFPLIYFTAQASKTRRVCLSGEGSDELHGGYTTSQPDQYEGGICESFARLANNFTLEDIGKLLGTSARSRLVEFMSSVDGVLEQSFVGDGRDTDVKFNKIRWFMLQYVMGRHILEKGDGMTMGVGPTELRMPFLSVPYAEYAATLPYAVCMLDNRRKGLCVSMARAIEAPGVILDRRQKQRTSLPYHALFFNSPEFGRYWRSVLNPRSMLCDYLQLRDPGDFVAEAAGHPNGHRQAWALLILELWLQKVFGDRN